MAITRKARGSGRSRRAGSKNKKGGSLLAGVVGALKTALPSIVLYEALRVQGKRVKKGGKKSRKMHKKRSHKKRHHKKRTHKRRSRKMHKKRSHKKRARSHRRRRR
jgi:hypothetical protein